MFHRIIVAGHLCLDLSPLFLWDDFPEPGHLTEIGPIRLWPGGAVGNVSLALNRLKINVEPFGFVGDDPLGDLLRTMFEQQIGRQLPGIQITSGARTSYTLILARSGQDRAFLHYTGVNGSFQPTKVDSKLLQGGDILHFGYPPLLRQVYEDGGLMLANWFQSLRERGLLISLDLTSPDPKGASGLVNWRKFLDRILPHVDIFAPSYNELLFMLREMRQFYGLSASNVPVCHESLAALGEWALEHGTRLFVLKLGVHGLYLRTAPTRDFPSISRLKLDSRWGNREIWAPAFHVTPIGTAGTGDSAIAGFLAGLLQKFPPEKAITIAAAVGACSAEAADPTGGIPPLTNIIKRINAGWAHVNDGFCPWQYDKLTGVFLGPQDAQFYA